MSVQSPVARLPGWGACRWIVRFKRLDEFLLVKAEAAVGAGAGLGLSVIGRLLGHTQPSTTARYAHLDNDPLRRASESIAGRIAAALERKQTSTVVPLRHRGKR